MAIHGRTPARLSWRALAARRAAMPATREDLLSALARLGIATTTIDHAPVFTVEEAQSLRGTGAWRPYQESVPEGQEGTACSWSWRRKTPSWT